MSTKYWIKRIKEDLDDVQDKLAHGEINYAYASGIYEALLNSICTHLEILENQKNGRKTNFESIRQGTHKAFNELISCRKNIAEMLCEISCDECICKAYCNKHPEGLNCLQIIGHWLDEEVQSNE